MVGALQYLTMTTPDIAYAVHVVFQYLHAFRTTHLHAIKRTFRYLQGTLHHSLHLRPAATPSIIVAYSDADLASCKDSCHSTTGYAVLFNPNLISWCSKKQPTVSKSSTEVEYRTVAYIVAETIWIRKLLHDLRLHLSTPTRVYYDKIRASSMAVNPVQHDRSKHKAIDYHFVRECVAHGALVVRYIPTKLQLVDVFTKGLFSKLLEFFRDNLSVRSSPID